MRGGAVFPVRLRYAKHGKIRFLGHRDVARAFERAFRIVALPLAFSEGFSPHPKISFGLALSVGYESDAEYLDVECREPVDLDELPHRLGAALPPGLVVTGAVELAPLAPALQEAVAVTAWRIELTGCDRAGAEALVARFLGSDRVEVPRRRKGRETIGDIRPAVGRLAVAGTTATGTELEVELATQPITARPAELVAALVGERTDLGLGRVTRTHQWIERDGARRDPLAADAHPVPRAPVPEMRAS